jgi:hypothetical protein
MPAVIVMTVMKTILMITRKKKIMTDIPPNIVRVMPIWFRENAQNACDASERTLQRERFRENGNCGNGMI